MKQFLFFLCITIMLLGAYSCGESDSGQPSITDLQKQIADLKNQLEKNTKIKTVAFEGNEMVLTFQDGSVFRTATPQSIIPNVGENGNWWVNGEDLGVKAEAQIPVVGENGNWWVDGKDTGKTSQGIKGDQGEDGRGIAKVEYDEKTGILKITLTDNTYYEYTLTVSDDGGDLSGNKIEDLNGAYLLSGIKNGDFPFAEFTYDNNNRLTVATYYQNLLNAPVKIIDLKQDHNTQGKLTQQTFTEYAPQETVVLNQHYDSGIFGEYELSDFVEMTANAIYNELFPVGIPGQQNVSQKQVIDYIILRNSYSKPLYNNNFIYWLKQIDGSLYMKKAPRVDIEEDGYAYALVKEGTSYYFYANSSIESSYKNVRIEYCYNVSDLIVEEYQPQDSGWELNMNFEEISSSEKFYPIYSKKYQAIKYTGAEDIKEGNIIKDYYTPAAEKCHNTTGETGKFKVLTDEYILRKQGDVIRDLVFNYTYNGNDYTVENGGENQFYVAMNGNKIDKIMVYENSQQKELLKFTYNADGNIDVINVDGVKDVAKFTYDSKQNPTMLSVNSYPLADKGYDDLFCALGLAYRYKTFDQNLQTIIEKVKYTNGYTPLLKISYNYSLKNFMNHTFTAFNPLFNSFFNSKNAISEIGWAGHGSCFMTEYSDYNEGGYPTRLKGILQLSDNVQDNEFDIPINSSIATLYKFEYQKKK